MYSPEKPQLAPSAARDRPLAKVDLSVPALTLTNTFIIDRISSDSVWYTNTSNTKPIADAISHDVSTVFENFSAAHGIEHTASKTL